MRKKINILISSTILVGLMIVLNSCNSANEKDNRVKIDSSAFEDDLKTDDIIQTDTISSNVTKDTSQKSIQTTTIAKTKVLVYYFHGTNRCPSCRAIEAATRKTIDTHFKKQLAENRVKFREINVDEEANKTISEKYEAYGASLFLTQIKNGKESRFNLTGDGFKYAPNNEEKFIEILKSKIEELLK